MPTTIRPIADDRLPIPDGRRLMPMPTADCRCR